MVKRTTPLQIQRKINSDYVVLFEDYKRLAAELWKVPAARFILSGIVLGMLIPVSSRGYSWAAKKIDEKQLEGKLDDLKEHFSQVDA